MTTQVVSKTHYTSAQFTRPGDTTQYTAGDVVCNAATLIFPGAIKNGSGLLHYATLSTSNNAAAKPTVELWMFSATVAAVADNAAFAPTDAEMLTHIGVVRFEASDFKIGLSGAVTNGNAVCAATGLGIPLERVSGGDGDIYGQLVDRTAAGYVCIASEVFKVRLGILD
jgi:hypothetical protein